MTQKYEIVDIAKSDGFYSLRENLIGKRGEITNKSTKWNNLWWKATEMKLDNGKECFFYKVRLKKVKNENL